MADKTVLITGCSSGIGRATAREFADSEWTVYATARDTGDIAGLESQGCETAELDVTKDDDVDRVVGRIESETGRIDCLVNNAGFGQHGPLEDIPTDRLHRQFDVNVYGPHRLTRAVLPLMRQREDGTIINVSSVYGRVVSPGAGTYAASKFALEAMSDALRSEVEGFDIDVVVVEPGPVETGFTDRSENELESLPRSAAYEWLYENIEDVMFATSSLPVASEPEDVATVIHDAGNMEDPDPRYPVGPVAKYLIYTRFLPDRLRDWAFRVFRRLA